MDYQANVISDMLSRKVKRGMVNAVECGAVVSFVPLGYTLQWKRAGKKIGLHTRRAAHVAQAFKLAADGLSLRSIQRQMMEAGMRGVNGKAISRTTLHGILRNPFYFGTMRFQGKLIQGKYQPIITRELFEEAQEKLAEHRMRPKA